VNCAIDDEVSRRGRSLEVSPLVSVRSMHPRFMTNHHRLRFVTFTYSRYFDKHERTECRARVSASSQSRSCDAGPRSSRDVIYNDERDVRDNARGWLSGARRRFERRASV